MSHASRMRPLAGLLLACFALTRCYSEGSRLAGKGGGRGRLLPEAGIPSVPGPDAAVSIPDSGPISALCLPAQSSEPLRARTAIMSDKVTAKPRAVYASELFSKFVTLCGNCHVSADNGGLHVNAGDFKDKIDAGDKPTLLRLKSEDPDDYMPPPPLGKKYSDRLPDDPIVLFAQELGVWFGKGKPNVFYVDPDAAADGTSPYLMSKALGTELTNIGNCIPDRDVVGLEKDEMKRMDELFAGIKSVSDLPKTLDGTDLVSFDSEKLARYGVIGFAPAYPLFSDHAKKIRYVRTPVGTSIRFNSDTKEFDVPPNTRFYKTFLKRVIDDKGNESYRKIETRLVLSRPDRTLGAEAGAAAGTVKVDAIFATWKWDYPDETVARLVNTSYIDGTGFADVEFTYAVDEGKAAAILADPSIKNPEFEVRDQGLVRTYGIPGSDRCLQCHMGSVSRAGVLGFTPLQIDRRKPGEGGIYEPAGPDELNQLQRLIDYGVITGMDGPGQVALEKSQELPPRNEYELNAQAYMVGNCGFCHNPRGYPTVQNPELRDLLNFWPGNGGGIFHFPLDRVSPRIHRGDTLDTAIPYITPSLFDFPRTNLSDAKQIVQGTENAGLPTQPNWYSAPWRSLIYRNVDTPFTYADDNAIFPHMPMNVPGYDCRTPKIMAEWMISIPAKWVRNDYNATRAADPNQALYVESCATTMPVVAGDELAKTEAPCGRRSLPVIDSINGTVRGSYANIADASPQPYEEVLPTDDGYDAALSAAQTRLLIYHSDERYKYYCPDDQAGSDIVDHTISEHPTDPVPQDDTWFDLQDGKQAYQWIADGVPDRPHWVVTDVTQPVGPWEPRRSDWKKVLFDEDIGPRPPDTDLLAGQKYDRLIPVVHLLSAKNPNPPRLTPELRTFVETPRPMSVWTRTDCSFDDSKQPLASSITPRPDWFDIAKVSDTARVYMQAPGSFIFTQVCSNCHGRLADSQGRLASKILELTGGNARVANFRDGIFGPLDHPGKYRSDVFDKTAATGGDSFLDGDDLAARYMALMGLGGTTKVIPQALLSVVGLTPVFGTPRFGGKATDANMLSIARLLCSEILPNRDASDQPTFEVKTGTFDLKGPSLQNLNGDTQLWRELCSFGNPSPVRAIELHPNQPHPVVFAPRTAFYKRTAFTASDPVGDPYGNVQIGIDAANLQPWCLKLEAQTPAALTAAETWWAANRKDDQQVLPKCPAQAVLDQNKFDVGAGADGPDRTQWIDRAAANAGFAVFAYLDDLTRGVVQPPDPFNDCPK